MVSAFLPYALQGEKLMTFSVLAAGSLRAIWPKLAVAWKQPVSVNFGPAGLLCERLKKGESCDLFLSANTAHPQSLLAENLALYSAVFTRNQLCLSVKETLAADRDWLALLSDPRLRVATSTPLSDPSGDYAWQLFDRMEEHYPGLGAALRKRAQPLVGGPNSPVVPAGESAAGWLLNRDRADIFIGYQSYAAPAGIAVITLPPPFQIRADYAFAVCHDKARPLANFLLSAEAQTILRQGRFLPLEEK